jgi:hypothetical protein
MRAGEPRVVVRLGGADRERLDRCARVAGVPLGSLMREVSLLYGPDWVAGRAADEFAGRPVERLRARNAGSP